MGEHRTKNKCGDSYKRLITFKFVLFQKQCSRLLHIEFLTKSVQWFYHEVRVKVFFKKKLVIFYYIQKDVVKVTGTKVKDLLL